MNYLKPVLAAVALVPLAVAGKSNASLTITLNPNSSLSGNAQALAAFNRAAQNWTNLFSNNVTVYINAGLASLGNGILGSTSSPQIGVSYATARTALQTNYAANVAQSYSGNAIVTSLPATMSAFTTAGNASTTTISTVGMTRANGRVLGLYNTVGSSSTPDASITFTTNFAFDYNNSDGVDPGKIDFESVATHEIGHALGFVSYVDAIDQGATDKTIADTLDLFRLNTTTANTIASNQATAAAGFFAATRDLRPSSDSATTDGNNVYRMSTGNATGDGNQASHWKADDITGTYIGVMDPSISNGFLANITQADIHAFDLMGYNLVATPEPVTLSLAGFATLVLGRQRRNREKH